MVTAVVCAAFDAATDARVQALRDAIAARGLRVRQAHRPHLTLDAARVDDPAPVIEVARAVAARHLPTRVWAFRLGSFRSGVLYVDVPVDTALLGLQQDVYAELGRRWPHASDEHSSPSQWVAHCTLATRVPPDELHDLVALPFEPFEVRIDALAVLAVGGRGDLAHLPLGAETLHAL